MSVMSRYDKLPDDELVTLLRQGDESAYTEIYHRYHAALYIHIFNKLRIREESRDIVHDLFSQLWQKRTALAIQGSLASYLFAAARYRVFDLIDRSKVKNKYIDSIRKFAEEGISETDYRIREQQLLALIEKEIASLPPKMRQVFELSRKGGLSHRQIGIELNLSEKTVKKQVSNSLKILRSKLGVSVFIFFFL